MLGSYNTVKATLPHLIASAEKAKAKKTSGMLPSFTACRRPTPFSLSHDLMTMSAGPRLIFVSATLHFSGTPLLTHAVAAKAAVDALSANCSLELGPRGITSNVISPGAIAGTEGMDRLSRRPSGVAHNKRIPLGRIGTVKDVADATVWICSEAADYINGTVVVGKLIPRTSAFTSSTSYLVFLAIF